MTLGFSLRRVFWDLLAIVILCAATAVGFLLADKFLDKGLLGLVSDQRFPASSLTAESLASPFFSQTA